MSTKQTTQDRQWYDDFLLELRLRDIKGPAIGDAIAEVEAHCADSGERPGDAFGDPRAYAASLEFAPSERETLDAAAWIKALAPAVAGVVAFVLTGAVVRALQAGITVGVSWGALAGVAFLVVATTLLVRFAASLLRRSWAMALFGGAAVMVGVLLPALWRTTAFRMPWWLGLVLLVGLLAFHVVALLRQGTQPDLAIDPRTGAETELARTKGALPAGRIVPWLVPALCLVWAVALWLIPS